MHDLTGKQILVGICGGVAAYKSAYLVRELRRLGAEVRVVMTQSAQQFISPLQMQALSGNSVRLDLFDPQAEEAMDHIALARWAHYLVVAPASANCLAKFAQGLADDLLSTLYLVAEIPIILCPAMNKSMWAHPATQANCQTLSQRGNLFVGPEEGIQACGEYGFGRLSEIEPIINALSIDSRSPLLSGKHLVITAGPTRERIDPVRYLSNDSSGKMGYALAEAALLAGAKVSLISGPTNLKPREGIECIRVESAQDMETAVMQTLTPGALFIGAAAVADYRVEEPSLDKIKKQKTDSLTLQLVKNNDILERVVASKQAAFVLGFAAETSDLLPNARHKLQHKKLHMVVANQVGDGLGFESDLNQVTILTKQQEISLPLMQKTLLAGKIIRIIAEALHKTPVPST
jgi:phosphopantothenoylcysteine decarboxylase/phosphopantothenate--cysteine ligase